MVKSNDRKTQLMSNIKNADVKYEIPFNGGLINLLDKNNLIQPIEHDSIKFLFLNKLLNCKKNINSKNYIDNGTLFFNCATIFGSINAFNHKNKKIYLQFLSLDNCQEEFFEAEYCENNLNVLSSGISNKIEHNSDLIIKYNAKEIEHIEIGIPVISFISASQIYQHSIFKSFNASDLIQFMSPL